MQPARVDAAHAARDHAPRARRCAARSGYSSSRASVGVLLGVVERAQRAQLAGRDRLVVEQHAPRPRAGRPASRARPRRRPRRSAPRGAGRRRTAVVRSATPPRAARRALPARPAPGAAQRRRVPAPRRRAARPSRRAARPSRRSEDPDPVGRPVGGEGPADDPGGRDRSPEPAVVGFPTVVAHHEPVAGGILIGFGKLHSGLAAAWRM